MVEAGGLAIEMARLRVELRRRLDEVEASRARIVAAGTEERRRIERDLHDGAQQRLVSIGLALRHAQHQLGAATPTRRRRRWTSAVVEITCRDRRAARAGARAARRPCSTRASARRCATWRAGRRLPVEVSATADRFAPDVEAAAYFVACEGLTNAVKHARADQVVLQAPRQNGTPRRHAWPTTASAARPSDGLRADRAVATGSPRAAGGSGSRAHRGHGTTLIAELPCAS